MKPEISVLIVTYNSAVYIVNCLKSLVSSKKINFEVILIDNNSTDNTLTLIKNYPVKIIKNNKNIGFGPANNLAARHAKGEYFFFLNPDCILTDQNLLYKLYIKMVKNKHLGVVSPNSFMDINNNKVHYSLPYVNRFGVIYHNIKFEDYKGRGITAYSKINGRSDPELLYTDSVRGAHLFVKKELFDKLGGFDESFFLYGEETDLCLRTWKAGYSVGIYLNCSIYHKGLSSPGIFNRYISWVSSQTTFIKKWVPYALPLWFLFYLPIRTWENTLDLLKFKKMWNTKVSIT